MPLENRSEHIDARVTAAEKTALQEAATAAGERLSDWARDILLSAARKAKRRESRAA